MTELVEPILEIGDIQGNIFPGFMKSHQVLLGLKILEPSAAKAWIKFITPEIATAEEVFQFKKLRSLMIKRRGYEPRGLAVVWTNIAFSVQGLRKLVDSTKFDKVDRFDDDGFRVGLPDRSSSIGDPADSKNVEGSPRNWKIGGSLDTIPDIFLIVAGDDPTSLKTTVTWIKDSIQQIPASVDRTSTVSGLEILYEESGEDLPGELSGHEHFGFKDGVSQPGIRGRLPEPPHDFLTPRYIDPQDPSSKLFSQPGQPLIWPGQFVFGYEFQGDLNATDIGKTKDSPAWAKNGSFLVFRRLRQDVGRFWKFMQSKAEELASQDGFNDMTSERLASLLVGRWPSGAPIMRTPNADNKELSKDFVNNHFNFDQPSQRIPIVPGSGQTDDNFALAPADREGFICPHAAHIRKVNPRDITTEGGADAEALTKRILRRGIPFGTMLDDLNNLDADPLEGNRGLLFLSYQTSILDQFEFLSKNWMNAEEAPEEYPGGHDFIVGQNPETPRRRRCTIRRKVDGQEVKAVIETEIDWVIPTGGGYFFAPSITTLKEILGAE